jgi:Protein of unknown function (DUF3703)
MLSNNSSQALSEEPAVFNQVAWLVQQARLEPAGSAKAWAWLEAAHIVGQTRFTLHCHVHCQMLLRASTESKGTEVLAQLLRLALTPFGHLLQRLPLGNPGSSRAGVFDDLPVPEHLITLIHQSRSIIKGEIS